MWMLWIAHRRKQNLKISKNERTCSLFKILSHRHFGYCATCILLHQNVKFFGGKNVSNWGNRRKRTIHEPIEIKIHNTYMNRGVGKSAFLPIGDIASAMYNWCNICTHEANMHALQHHCGPPSITALGAFSDVTWLFALGFILGTTFKIPRF